jgi:beta-galactosidase
MIHRLILVSLIAGVCWAGLAENAQPFVCPHSPRAVLNFNAGWKFIREDVSNAAHAEFDDSKWASVCTPHTYNDVDSYDEIISHSGGERHLYTGVAWYRKHFRLPASARGGKVFLELEGLKQAGRFWVNGKYAGKHENGVTACGLDLTGLVVFGEKENVIAVKVDNSNGYQEEDTGVEYQWMGRAFNPNYGGLNRNIWLHLTSKIYQTLPLYGNLATTGAYIHAAEFSIANGTCEVAVESQVRNETGEQQSVTLTAVVVDAEGVERARFEGEASDLVDGQTETLNASGKLKGARFWSPETPSLYDVYCVLKANDQVVDVQRVRAGFRKTEFKGGAGTGGVFVNDRFVYLTGYAQRSVNEWAGLGQAYPDWMHDYNADLMRSTHANYVRWMHIAPQRVDVSACDRAGIIQICPAGDKEKDAVGRQWAQRVEVMRDTMIYYRNSPSILFWEAGNNHISLEHMKEMVELRKKWDPAGGRVMGCRTLNDPAATDVAEYFGVMIGQDPRVDELAGNTNLFRAYSQARRDRAPIIETEDFRDEAARRYWDEYSPPYYGFKKGPEDTYSWNSESFCLAAAGRYYDYSRNRIDNRDPAHSRWSGYASIYWSDSNADGRQDSSEVCRVSGKVDSVRLPKQAYYVYRVMQNPMPDIHIIGHWSYPSNTVKTIYVAANHCASVELLVNGVSQGVNSNAVDGYVYAFQNISFEPGQLRAVARDHEPVVAEAQLETVGPPKALRLTPHTGPAGLIADGGDVAFYDLEVVDARGQRCPTDDERVDFRLEGPAVWRGGYNSGRPGSVNQPYLFTECGINRVMIRSTDVPGKIKLTASRAGLAQAVSVLKSVPGSR